MTDRPPSEGPPGSIDTTQPYPWPWDGAFRPDRVCLVVTGTQRAHADASIGARPVADVIVTLAGAVRGAGGVVCHVRHTAATTRVRPSLPRIGDEGWAPVLRAAPEDLMVEAFGHDGFCGSGLDLELRGRGLDLLVAVGMAAEVTVSSTVRSANDRGYECLTLADAAAPLEEFTGERHLHSVTMSGGIFGAIGTSAELLELLRSHSDRSHSDRSHTDRSPSLTTSAPAPHGDQP
jgi:biuret amidohydrolase